MTRFALMVGGLSLIVGGACSKNKNPLEPAPEAATRGDDTIVSTVEGATMTAEVGAWPGAEQVLSEVTPVRVTIENTSEQPLRLQYRNFQLVAADGTVYHALPPFQIEGEIDRPMAIYDPIADPDFYYDGFEVAPYYGRVYPGISVYDDYYDYDPYYYDTYYRTWYEVELPTRTMVRRALPEGVIREGGRVSGFLYFERIPEGKQRAELRAEMIDAQTGRVISTARIPFVVAG